MKLFKLLILLLAVIFSMPPMNLKAMASQSHLHSDQKENHGDHGDEGFKLSAEAVKNFGITTLRLVKSGPWTVPTSAVLYSAEEVNLYRLRNGFFKRIDFTTEKRSPAELLVRSKDLKDHDEVVVQGVGFLRTAELMATGGAPEGHSH
ncbi:hypothetical protein B9G69_009935 [Bdellovibrio sp. SKB1291214]|uniref:hypothetical protein n=1 Tax=Bdellovibrio sp. SKB1291214 TaxID=1732569 RepID=UPI000B517497|nr:hypothetical protein [Bdellovibrio sp. SKB1291214]UYL07365.1 hypothetical protein B9G69_009935 [Bdellovibrio sp. SKB1291214]